MELPAATPKSNDQSPSQYKGCIDIFTVAFQSPFYSQIIQATYNYLTARGYLSRVRSNTTPRTLPLLSSGSLNELECDGLIIHANTMSEDELNIILDRFKTTVVLNHKLDDYLQHCVYTDNELGGRLAARHLLEHGHQNFAMITGPSRYVEARDRSAGFESELQLHGLTTKIQIEGDFRTTSGKTAMETILNSGNHITAVFAQNDDMAFSALTQCRRRGVRVPEDLSIIGYDGLTMCNFVTPKLTSIQQPLRLMGEQAGRIVCDMLENLTTLPAQPNEYIPVLAERESVAPPPDYQYNRISLTSREIECLNWTAQGKTSWEISVILGLSESTVTFHLRNAVLKLQASNRTHAVAKAIQSGQIRLPLP